MGGTSIEKEVAVMQNDMKYVGRTVTKLDANMDLVLQFMAAQEEKNETAQRERERIFKASTLLPAAILTAVINIGMNYLMRVEPPPTQTPTQNAYITPSQRSDPKQIGELKVTK